MLDLFVFEPFSVNQSLIDSLLLETDSFEVWVAWAASGSLSGSGSICDPYLVSSAIDFDNLLASFSPSTTLYLAPGTYLSQGHAEGLTTGWKPRRGQRIVGAGVDLTVIQLNVASPTTDKAYFVIGSDDADDLSEFEASDMTLDAHQGLAAHSSIAAGGVKAFGTHILLRRLRIINFGSQTISQPGVAVATAGAFPGKPQPFDAVVEECEFELPGQNNVRETACISFAGVEGASDGVPGLHKACVARDCIINCNYVSNEVPVGSIAINTTTKIATVTTKVAHGLSSTPWVVISEALEVSQPSTHFNGSFQVISIPDSTSFTVAYYESGSPPTAVVPTGDMWVGRAPSQRVAISSISFSGGYAVVTTATPHYRAPGQKVVLNNVTGMTPTLSGAFTVADLGSGTAPQRTIRVSYSGSGSVGISQAYIGIDFYGITPGSGIGSIIENNRILNTTFGIYHDTGSAKDVTIRDNYFSAVLSAVYYKLGQVSGGNSSGVPVRAGSSLTRDGILALCTLGVEHGLLPGVSIPIAGASPSAYNGTFPVAWVPSTMTFTYILLSDPIYNASGTILVGSTGTPATSLLRKKWLATFTTMSPHGLAQGQGVSIISSTTGYTGIFPIASVPSPTSFTYIVATSLSSPELSADASGSVYFGALWQIGRLVIEHNTVELVPTITAGIDLPTAIRLERLLTSGPPYVFSQAMVRGNVVRLPEIFSDPTALAIQLNSCEGAIVEENVIDLDNDKPIEFTACAAVKFFNNQAPSGALIQGYDTVNAQFVNELTTDADLSALLAT